MLLQYLGAGKKQNLRPHSDLLNHHILMGPSSKVYARSSLKGTDSSSLYQPFSSPNHSPNWHPNYLPKTQGGHCFQRSMKVSTLILGFSVQLLSLSFAPKSLSCLLSRSALSSSHSFEESAFPLVSRSLGIIAMSHYDEQIKAPQSIFEQAALQSLKYIDQHWAQSEDHSNLASECCFHFYRKRSKDHVCHTYFRVPAEPHRQGIWKALYTGNGYVKVCSKGWNENLLRSPLRITWVKQSSVGFLESRGCC